MLRRLEAPLALFLFGLATVAWTWPLVLRWNESMAGSLGDPLLLAWTLEWDLHALARGLSPWDANIFHPSRLALVFSDHLLGQAPFFWLGRQLGFGTAGAYNFTFVSMVTLSGFSAWLLARRACGSAWIALVAGAVYAFAPWRLAHVDHMVFLSTAGYPLALLAWTLSLDPEASSRRRLAMAAAAAAALAWQSLCGGYHAVYATALMPLLALLVAFRARSVKAGAWAVLPVAVGLGVTLPALMPYLEMKRTIGHLSGAHPDWGAGLLSLILAPSSDIAWGWTARVLGAATSPEAMLFPGLLALVLAAAGARAAFGADSTPADARDTPPSRVGRALTVLIVLLLAWATFIQVTGGGAYSLGPLVIRARGTSAPVSFLVILVVLRVVLDASLRRRVGRHLEQAPLLFAALAVMAGVGLLLSFYGPTALLGRVVPGLGSLRVPARAFLLALLPLAVFAARGLQGLAGSTRVVALSLLAFCVVLGEGLGLPMPVGAPLDAANRVPRPAALAGPAGDLYRWLSAQPSGTVVAEIPLGTPALDLWYEYASTLHWQPIINGSSGYSPRYYAGLAECLQRFPSPTSVEALQELGARLVVVHLGFLDPSERTRIQSAAGSSPLREVARHGDDVVYALDGVARVPVEESLGEEIPRQGWRVQASVEPGPLRTVDRMLDGDFRTRWATERPQQAGDSVTLDMGRVETVGAVVLELGNHASDYPRALRIDASEDGQSWLEAGRFTRDCPPLRACLERPLDPWVTLRVGSQRARWLRLVLEADAPAFWCVAEIRAHRPLPGR